MYHNPLLPINMYNDPFSVKLNVARFQIAGNKMQRLKWKEKRNKTARQSSTLKHLTHKL